MDNLQYLIMIYIYKYMTLSFKPYYKWIIFNIKVNIVLDYDRDLEF